MAHDRVPRWQAVAGVGVGRGCGCGGCSLVTPRARHPFRRGTPRPMLPRQAPPPGIRWAPLQPNDGVWVFCTFSPCSMFVSTGTAAGPTHFTFSQDPPSCSA